MDHQVAVVSNDQEVRSDMSPYPSAPRSHTQLWCWCEAIASLPLLSPLTTHPLTEVHPLTHSHTNSLISEMEVQTNTLVAYLFVLMYITVSHYTFCLSVPGC